MNEFIYRRNDRVTPPCNPGVEAVPAALRLVGKRVRLTMASSRYYLGWWNPASRDEPITVEGVMYVNDAWRLITNVRNPSGTHWCPRLGIIKSAEIVSDNLVRFCS